MFFHKERDGLPCRPAGGVLATRHAIAWAFGLLERTKYTQNVIERGAEALDVAPPL